MKFRSDKEVLLKELFRKTIHMCCGIVPFALKLLYWPVIIFFLLLAVIYFISEVLRIKGKSFPLVTWFTGFAIRNEDKQKLSLGPVFMVLGFVVTALLLPLEYASAGIYALAFGDGIASLAGKAFGRIKIPGSEKTLAGSGACFAAVFISTFLLSKNIVISIITAIIATFLEYLPLKSLDNFFIPVFISASYCLLSLIIK